MTIWQRWPGRPAPRGLALKGFRAQVAHTIVVALIAALSSWSARPLVLVWILIGTHHDQFDKLRVGKAAPTAEPVPHVGLDGTGDDRLPAIAFAGQFRPPAVQSGWGDDGVRGHGFLIPA